MLKHLKAFFPSSYISDKTIKLFQLKSKEQRPLPPVKFVRLFQLELLMQL